MGANKVIFLAVLAGTLVFGNTVQAIPELQLYIEGAVYDTSTETWVADFDSTHPIRLWAIADVGAKGRIDGVKLAIAYDYVAGAPAPTFSLTPSTTVGFGGFTDPVAPGSPNWIQTRTDGSLPQLSGGKPLPSQGIYGTGTAWSEYSLGDFTLTDSLIADFSNSLPNPATAMGQISVYEISVTGTATVHFDLYDHYYCRNRAKAVFAPFSHDAEGNNVPDGGMTMMLLGMGFTVLGALHRRIRK